MYRLLTSARTLTGAAFSANCRGQAHWGFLRGKARVAHERFEVDGGSWDLQFRDRMNANPGTAKAASREAAINLPVMTRTGTDNTESPDGVGAQVAQERWTSQGGSG